MSFGGDCGKVKDTGSVVSAVKNAVAAMVVAIPEITIKDEEDEFDAWGGNEEYKKIHKVVVEYTTPIINALKEWPIHYQNHIKKRLTHIKGQKEKVKLVRYQNFIKSQQQTLKRIEKKHKEIKKEEDVEDELGNQFNIIMNISTKRRRV